jgi:hypothetical protein
VPALPLAACVLAACGLDVDTADTASDVPTPLDRVAEQYVKTALAFRAYDDSYVDAYYGPIAWSEEAESRAVSLEELKTEAENQLAVVRAIEVSADPEVVAARKDGLQKRLLALLLRMDMAAGSRLAFEDESRTLFDAVAPVVDETYLRNLIFEIDRLVPGAGNLSDRVNEFRSGFIIPSERLADVFDAAIEECRRRTLEHIALPANESFTIEYVTDQPWSGYNWYQGDSHSLIQINTDLPIYIDRAIDLGCHEGYPGHHTYGVLMEAELVDARGWIEFALSPLYGPLSLISEGSANYGIELAFSDAEREAFEKEVLFPLAGLNIDEADRYHDLSDALEDLRYAEVVVARDYLDGDKTSAEAIAWLREYALLSEERASQRIRFFDTYRSYVINYSFGRDLIEQYLAERVGADRGLQWREFQGLLSRPMSPSDLQ